MTTRTAYLLLLLTAWLAAVYDATRLGEWQHPDVQSLHGPRYHRQNP